MRRIKRAFWALSLVGGILIATVKPVNASNLRVNLDEDFSVKNNSIQYLEYEIDQGLEFIVLDKKNKKDIIKHLVKNTSGGLNAYYYYDGESRKKVTLKKAAKSSASSFNNPKTPISKQVTNRVLRGVWWGGILDDVGIVGTVAASTKATSRLTESKASVKAGANGKWKTGGWKDTGVISSVMESVGISSNKSKWDLIWHI